MKALVYHDRGDLRYEEDYPEPQIIQPNDVKIKIHYCGICGTDLKEFTEGPIFFPKKGEVHEISQMFGGIIGHEISGEIVEIGPQVTDIKIGDTVVVEVTGTCQDRSRFPNTPQKPPCPSCKDGHYNACDYLGLTGCGFTDGGCAEYMVTADSKVIPFKGIPMDIAALIQPIAVSWHAVKVSNFKPGESALILGGGPIGLTTIFALKGNQVGHIVVSEPALARRQLAEKLGVTTYDPTGKSVNECVEDLKKLSPDGLGFKYSYDCSGIPITFDIALKALKIRGCSTNVAIWAHKAIDYFPMEVTFNEKVLTGSICFVKEDFVESVKAIEEGSIPIEELQLLISSKIHLENAVKDGFIELVNHKDKHIKILFTPKEEYRINKDAHI